MEKLLTRSLAIALAVTLLTGCSSSESESEDTSESGGGGNYLSCVLEYNEAVRAGVLDATQAEINEECRSQYQP
jgi:hypothetical protein